MEASVRLRRGRRISCRVGLILSTGMVLQRVAMSFKAESFKEGRVVSERAIPAADLKRWSRTSWPSAALAADTRPMKERFWIAWSAG